jgi:hypothetical protein
MEEAEPATAVETLFSRLDANTKAGKQKKSLKTVDESAARAGNQLC